jgi:hypothetical protein
MAQHLVNAVFSESMLYVVVLSPTIPTGMKFVHFDGHFAHLLNVKALVHFAKASFSKHSQELILSDAGPVAASSL